MKSITKHIGAVVVGLFATCGVAFAGAGPFNAVPEPGSIALVGLALAGLVVITRRNKK